MDRLRLTTTSMAAGGDAIGRDEGGRVVFVDGALPGELVEVEVIDERRDFARARVVDVLSPSPSRVTPPCPALLEGCGGCQWQHVAEPDQLPLKISVVVDALRRLGRFAPDDIPTVTGGSVAAAGHRTTLRLAVDRDGRPSYRLRHSHELLAPTACAVAHPRLEELVVAGRFPRAREVTARVSASTGDRIAVVTPRAGKAEVPDDVVVVGVDELKRGRQVFIDEDVAGRTWRVSALSFFQSGPTGAAALAEVVDRLVGTVAEGGLVVDAYAGVGLLGGVVAARRGARLVAVESSASSVADARANLRDLEHTVVRAPVERWRPSLPSPPDVVIADPPRAGLGARAAALLAELGAPRIVLVACDPASLARDARQLVDAGYTLSAVDVVDLFPHTFHVEAVARFERIVRVGQHEVPSR